MLMGHIDGIRFVRVLAFLLLVRKELGLNIPRGTAALAYFSSTVVQKWLKIEMAENFKNASEKTRF